MREDSARIASMSDERRQRILDIAEALEAEGLAATNSAVYARALGYRGHVVAVMKQRRAERAAAGGVAVEEEEEDEPEEVEAETPAATIQEDLAQLERVFEAWHLALERLWQIEQDGPLSESNFARKQWLEYQMVQNMQTQERLRPALAQAQKREEALRGRDQHDAALPAARAGAEAVLGTLGLLQDRLAALAAVFSGMVEGLVVVRDARNHQAFDALGDGQTEVVRLVSAFFPGDFRAKHLVELLLGTDLTKEVRWAEALAQCPRLTPFSASAMANYLHSITPQPEGSTNGSR